MRARQLRLRADGGTKPPDMPSLPKEGATRYELGVLSAAQQPMLAAGSALARPAAAIVGVTHVESRRRLEAWHLGCSINTTNLPPCW